MSRLIFDYFVWIDADTLFLRNPIDVLGLLSRSPIHVPLGRNLMEGSEEASWNGISDARLCQLFRDHGVQNRAYAASSAFWILHHDAIEPVYDLALQFWHSAKEAGTVLDVSAVLAYAMQMLCADPEAHLAEDRTDIWGSDDDGALLKDLQLDNGLPPSRFVLSALRAPAILHIPKSNVLTRSGTSLKASQGVGTG